MAFKSAEISEGTPWGKIAASVIGVDFRMSGAVGEMESPGWGAVHRVVRDGTPHKGKMAAAAGGGNLVVVDVSSSSCAVKKATSAYCREISWVIKTHYELSL